MLRIVSAFLVVVALSLAASAALRPETVGAAHATAAPGLLAQGSGAPPQRPEGPPPGAPGGPQGGPPPGGMRPPLGPPPDSAAGERDSLMNDVLQRIAGKENMPAESVFKNIKVMNGTPAGRLVRIMNNGFGRNLGVGCNFCHVAGHWADDDKPKKEIARGMMQMVRTINGELLPKIKNLAEGEEDKPTVNCGMCHRGYSKPGRGMQQGPGGRPGGR